MDPVEPPLPNVPDVQGDANDNDEPDLPLLIVGPSGSGKTFELTSQALREILKRLNAPNERFGSHMKALCMTPFNTATSNLTAKIVKVLEESIREDGLLMAPDRPPIVDPICTTIHHTCRHWLAKYGHLIGEPNMAEVCAEERAKRLLELLQLPVIERVRNEMVEELTLGVPNFEFLQNAMQAAESCFETGLLPVSLQEFIRLYKINDSRITREIYERFGQGEIDDHALDMLEFLDEEQFDIEIRNQLVQAGETKIFSGIEMQEWYDAILRHNRLYDFQDLVIFGARLVDRHARYIIKVEKIGLLVIDDFQNTFRQQRRFLKSLMSIEGYQMKLIIACNDHHVAQTVGGDMNDLDRTAYAFTGAHISLTPDDLMAEILPEGAFYQHVDFRMNRRSSSNVQHIAYGIFNRHLLNLNREGVQHQPVAVGSLNIPAEAQFIQEEVDRIRVEEYHPERTVSSVAIMTRTNANVRFLVDALTRIYCPIRVMGLENIDICSNEALDILSFLGAVQNPALHHLVERSLTIFSKCRNNAEPHFGNLPATGTIIAFIEGNFIDRGENDISEHHRQYLDLLRRLRGSINMRGGQLREAVDALLEELQYKQRILRTRLAPDGSPSPPPEFDMNENAPHPSSDYAGARWQNIRSFLIRLSDFDDRIADYHDPLDLFLRECHAYAPEQLAYIRRTPEIQQGEITISTMHYGIGTEYDVVIISGAEKGSLPNPACRNIADVQQDKTLFHLCMLCARKRLYFCFLQEHGLTSFLDEVYNLLHFRRNLRERYVQ